MSKKLTCVAALLLLLGTCEVPAQVNGNVNNGGKPNVGQATGTLTVGHGGTGATSFTADSVPYMGAGGAFIEDNTNLVFNNSTKELRVGGDIRALSGGAAGVRTIYSINDTGHIAQIINRGSTNACNGGLSAGDCVEFTTNSTSAVFGITGNFPICLVTQNTCRLTITGAGAAAFSSTVSATVFGVSALTTWANNQTCTAGQIMVDAGFIYVCTATNTVKRATLSTF